MGGDDTASADHVRLALVRTTTGPAPSAAVRSGCAADAIARMDGILLTNIGKIESESIAFRGSAAMQGSLVLCRTGMLLVDDAVLRLSDGKVVLPRDDELVLERVRGTITLASGLFAPDELGAANAATSGALALVGNASSRLLPGLGPGMFDAVVAVDDGRVSSNSHVKVNLGSDDSDASSVSAMVTTDDEGAVATIHAKKLYAHPRTFPSGVSVDRARVDLRAPPILMADPLRGLTGRIESDGVEFNLADVAPLRSLVGSCVPMRGAGHLELNDGLASGSFDAATGSGECATGITAVKGVIQTSLRVERFVIGEHQAAVRASAQHTVDHKPTLSLRLDDAVVDLGQATAVRGDLEIEARNAIPIVSALTGASLPPLVTALGSASPMKVEGALDLDASELVLRELHGHIGVASVAGELRRPHELGANPHARLLFELGPFATGVAVANGETTFTFADARRWFVDSTLGPE